MVSARDVADGGGRLRGGDPSTPLRCAQGDMWVARKRAGLKPVPTGEWRLLLRWVVGCGLGTGSCLRRSKRGGGGWGGGVLGAGGGKSAPQPDSSSRGLLSEKRGKGEMPVLADPHWEPACGGTRGENGVEWPRDPSSRGLLRMTCGLGGRRGRFANRPYQSTLWAESE